MGDAETESRGMLGVLIIGSLCWDCACHRKQWRGNRLNWDKKRPVRAPIRYGLRSIHK